MIVSPEPGESAPRSTPLSFVFQSWWPLAASWLLMGLEPVLLTAVMARLRDPMIHLAAYGGIVFPIALIVEAPIIMLLAASTALVRDEASYRRLRRFMTTSAVALTGIHLAVAATPLYDLLVDRLIGAPPEIQDPGRLGLLILTPWTAAIAYRRFQQGILIRNGHPRAVGLGTLVRLAAVTLVLGVGIAAGPWPGIVIGSAAMTAGVLAEALVAGLWVRPVLRERVLPAPAVTPALTLRGLFDFYVPLALTSFLALLSLPLASAGLARMPMALESLAVWPVMTGLVFLLRSLGMAYNEVVVALLERPGSGPPLFRFALLLGGAATVAHAVLAGTPLGGLWMRHVAGLTPDLARLGVSALWCALLLPALGFGQSWFQGNLLHERRTRGISESVAVSLFVQGALLALGVVWGRIPGIYAGAAAASAGGLAQMLWLRKRWRGGSGS